MIKSALIQLLFLLPRLISISLFSCNLFPFQFVVLIASLWTCSDFFLSPDCLTQRGLMVFMHLGLHLAYNVLNHSNLEAAGAGLSSPFSEYAARAGEKGTGALTGRLLVEYLTPANPTLVAPPGILGAEAGSRSVCAEEGQWVAGFTLHAKPRSCIQYKVLCCTRQSSVHLILAFLLWVVTYVHAQRHFARSSYLCYSWSISLHSCFLCSLISWRFQFLLHYLMLICAMGIMYMSSLLY